MCVVTEVATAFEFATTYFRINNKKNVFPILPLGSEVFMSPE